MKLSKSQITRLIKDGAIDVDGEAIRDSDAIMEVYSDFRIGKKTFKRVFFYKGRLKDLIYDILNEDTK